MNDSILEATEVKIQKLSKRKYSYHWMTKDFNLIIWWDNALHHLKIKSFPHHKHMKDEKNIFESFDVKLEDVLKEIEIILLD